MVTKLHLPSLMSFSTQVMSGFFEVNGEATDASSSDRETPTWALFKAAQSLLPSPHIKVVYPISVSAFMCRALCSGFILASTRPRAASIFSHIGKCVAIITKSEPVHSMEKRAVPVWEIFGQKIVIFL